mmetsp:Transcript_56798/g.176491  ORF Transcript_56798/g.176491 Transcript_56798/m.176491 type:complete len:610 (-) Transcript_56798:129-1958(-)
MLASALRSLIVVECEGGDGLVPRGPSLTASALLDVPLDGGSAACLDWDAVGGRVVVGVAGGAGGIDRIRIARLPAAGASPREEEVRLPAGVGVGDVSVACKPELGATWAAVACTDGALRIVDVSPGSTAAVARTCYSHGVAATAVHLSADAQRLASGSASGHVLVESPWGSTGPSPLPGLAEGPDSAAVTGLRFSPLRHETLAACDVAGNLQVWDARLLQHVCRFPCAHGGAARGLSFSMHNSDLLISGGDDSQLIFWDVNNGRQIREVGVEMGLASLSYHAGGYLLAAGTCDGSVLIFDLRMLVSKTQPALPVHRFVQHQARGGGSVKAMAFAPFDRGHARVEPAMAAVGRAPANPGGGQHDTADDPQRAAPGVAADEAGVLGAPTAATLQSMMSRLSFRASLGSAASAGLPPRSSSRAGGKDGRGSRGSSTPLVPQSELPAEGHEAEPDAAAAGLRSEPPLRPPATVAAPPSAPLPATPTPHGERPRRQAAAPPETPAEGPRAGQAARFSIASTPPEQAHVTSSPWWGAEQPGAEEPGPAAGPGPPAALAEALRPLLGELRRELLQELRESQCAVLEQAFRLNTELRRDVEELRAEVQELRGELRVL